jgi:VanZ family protein
LNLSRQRLRHFWLLAGWLLVVAVIYESLTSEPIELRVDQGDKLLHTAAYLVLIRTACASWSRSSTGRVATDRNGD